MKALDVLGLDHVAQKIYDLINSGGSADYIVEEGQDGPWHYRKWASGVSECWAIEYSLGSCAMTSKYGNAWYVAKSGFSFPVDSNGNRIFISNPYLNISCRADSGLINASIYYCSKDSYSFYLYDMQSETKTVYIDVYAKGLWKAFTPSSTGSTYSPIDLNALNKDALRYIKCANKGITNANNMTDNGIYTGYNLSNAPQTGWTTYIVFKHDNNSNYIHQIAYPIGNASKFWIRAYNGSNGWTSWNQYNQN